MNTILIDEYITSASLMGTTWAHCKFLLTDLQAQQVVFSSLRNEDVLHVVGECAASGKAGAGANLSLS